MVFLAEALFSLVIVTLSLNEGNPPFYLAVLIVFGFFALSYICHTLLNWILAYEVRTVVVKFFWIKTKIFCWNKMTEKNNNG